MNTMNYMRTLAETRTIIEMAVNHSKVIALNCDSNCCLQNGIDLLEVAAMNESGASANLRVRHAPAKMFECSNFDSPSGSRFNKVHVCNHFGQIRSAKVSKHLLG